MIDEQAILAAERLRDDLAEFRRLLRNRYHSGSGQVSADEYRKHAARLAETWLVELANDHALGIAIGSATLADLNVHFQRILTFAEHSTKRSRYDAELRGILDNYSVKVIVPLKKSRGRIVNTQLPDGRVKTAVHSAFLGQS